MFNEKEKAIIQLVSAAIASGSSVDDAFEIADEVLARLTKKEETGKKDITWEEIAHGNPNPQWQISITPEYKGDDEIYRYDVRRIDGERGPIAAARMTPAQGKILLEMWDRGAVSVDTLIMRAYPDPNVVTDQMVYSAIRGLKRHFADMGFENAIQNSRKFGFYLDPKIGITVLSSEG